jgi:hypothetical protein
MLLRFFFVTDFQSKSQTGYPYKFRINGYFTIVV